MFKKLANHRVLIICAILLAFLLSLGIHQIYHQDEYRWIAIANHTPDAYSPHPPMAATLFTIAGNLFGFDMLRVVPALFAILNLLLVYLICLKLTKNKYIAEIAAGLFSITAYSLIAGLQIDIDGALLPFFVLLGYYSYLYLRESFSKKWLIIFGFAVVGGFLTKLSFAIFVGALALDYALIIYEKRRGNIKAIFLKLLPWLFGVIVLAVGFYYIYATHFGTIIDYAQHFKSLDFGSRAYLDLVFKILKSFGLLSPLLTLPLGYALFNRELRQRYRLLFIYLLFNILFYTVIFDFTTLTIERYFMFLIAPAVIISAEVLWLFLKETKVSKTQWLFGGLVVAVLSYILFAVPQVALPLNPKIEYFNHLKKLNLNFLIPFTGGSGPIGFYFSASFMFWAWLVSALSLAGYWLVPKFKKIFVVALISVGLVYILLFSSEFLFGTLFGSVPAVARETVDYVNNNPNIKAQDVITYYDIAPYDLRISGKYYSRFYTAPNRDYTIKLTTFRGYYMVVNFPAIDKSSLYWQLIARCPIEKQFQDKQIFSYVFNCTKLKK